MRRKYWYLALCALLSASGYGFFGAPVAHAQQLRPYFLTIVDTSGSMGWCAGGTQNANGADDCSCYNNAPLCSGAFKKNRCGFDANKLGDAKCALQRILDGVGGDATFGLMQFEHPCSGTCQPTGDQCGVSCGPGCGDGQLAVDITSGNANLMREWVDGQCQGSCSNGYTHELTTGQWTPLGLSLQRANSYLRGTGGVPLATGSGAMQPLANDPQLACRPVSVILLTDGDDTCSDPNLAVTAAGALNNGDPAAGNASGKAFRTYVIGFGASGGNFKPAVLNQIAAAGGTNANKGGNRYFAAQNEGELSIALSQILNDAQPPKEVCDNQDNDCDGNVDEGLPKFCDKPHGVTDPTLCNEPNETNCDGIDDDCDGVIDEGLTNACGSCGDVPKETCDGLDNDCDNRIDEDTNNMESCGKDTGECKTGELVCVAGMEKCEGEIGPSDELCDCKDNDCDGTSDEENPNKLCPEGQKCAGCRCVRFCDPTVEFAATCPDGLRSDIQPNGECLCVTDDCDVKSCAGETHDADGEVVCAPNNAKVAKCLCRAGSCVDLCNGVSCKSGETCNHKSGKCVEDSCRGLGCASGLLCDPVAGRCVEDTCANAKCASDQVCRAGECEASCAATSCSSDQLCKSGSCQTNPCAKKRCDLNQICILDTGECSEDKCAGLQCKPGQVCGKSSGKCEADPCWNVKCPTNQACGEGECLFIKQPPTTGDAIAPAAGRLLATGGGGCACSVPGPSHAVGGLRALGVWLGLLGMVWLRARRRRQLQAPWLRYLALVGLACALTSLGGCRISPLCIDCTDSGSQGGSGSTNNGSDTGDGNVIDSGTGDSVIDSGTGNGMTGMGNTGGSGGSMSGPKCMPADHETCNDKDDDCDFKVDEDVVPTTNDCNQVGVCAGTKPICAKGEFICRFGTTYEMTESLCDGLDNDCNGKVDEAFPMLGATCEVGVGACKKQGTYHCNSSGKGLICDATPGTGSDEICNGLDDDCDGMVDEPKDNPGTHPSYVHDEVVKLKDNLWIYTYEASRVDSTDKAPGIVSTRTCSRSGVLPWTNVTYTEAAAACQTVGMTLCNLNDWVDACKGGNNCAWGSSSSCNSYDDGSCNAHDPNTAPGQTEDDALKPSGSFKNCYQDFGGAGKVYDLSGNAREWTIGDQSPDQNPLRGGSYNNNPEALRCDFDFNLATADLRLPNVGFRCCTSNAP